jgi:MFS family permease
MQSRNRIYPGWWIVAASALGLLLSATPIVVFSFSVFLKPLASHFHVGRAAVSLALTLHHLVSALGHPFGGKLMDRFGAKRVLIPFTTLSGLILICTYFASTPVWQLYAFYIGMGVAAWGTGPLAYSTIVSRWFDKNRGLALGAAIAGLGVGALSVPLLAHTLVAKFDWRFTFFLAGLTILFITVPVQTFFLKDSPSGEPLLDQQTKAQPSLAGVSAQEAFRTSTFWILLAGFVLVSMSIHACFTHLVPIFSDRAIRLSSPAIASSVLGIGLLIGRLGTGYLLDRFFAPRVASLIFAVAASGILLLRLAGSPALSLIAAFLVGIGLGAETDVMAFLASRYFGLTSFGQIYGTLFAGFALAGGLGTYLMGLIFDSTHSYSPGLSAFPFVCLAGAALMLLLGPYRYKARSSIAPESMPAVPINSIELPKGIPL